jgi:hypothetical protein
LHFRGEGLEGATDRELREGMLRGRAPDLCPSTTGIQACASVRSLYKHTALKTPCPFGLPKFHPYDGVRGCPGYGGRSEASWPDPMRLFHLCSKLLCQCARRWPLSRSHCPMNWMTANIRRNSSHIALIPTRHRIVFPSLTRASFRAILRGSPRGEWAPNQDPRGDRFVRRDGKKITCAKGKWRATCETMRTVSTE